jgi:hypothetical protein
VRHPRHRDQPFRVATKTTNMFPSLF